MFDFNALLHYCNRGRSITLISTVIVVARLQSYWQTCNLNRNRGRSRNRDCSRGRDRHGGRDHSGAPWGWREGGRGGPAAEPSSTAVSQMSPSPTMIIAIVIIIISVAILVPADVPVHNFWPFSAPVVLPRFGKPPHRVLHKGPLSIQAAPKNIFCVEASPCR